MMDIEVAFEALGVLCNAEVTSVQRQGADTPGGSAHSAPLPLTVNDFAHRVWRGDEFRPVQGIPSLQATMISERKLSIGTDEDSRGNFQLEVNKNKFFDPRFHYDFTNVTDQQTFYRGGEKYERPCGWKRFGLKVLGEYDDDTWLGNNQRKRQSVAGEWPVSYHGTSREGAEGIVEGNYKAGDGDVYGRGIYSTPNIFEASPYIKTFQSEKTKKWYKVLLQNRINPEYRKKCNDDRFCLVEIPEGTSDDKEREMVNRAIRPYGLLLKEI